MLGIRDVIKNLEDIKHQKTWNTAGDETFDYALKVLREKELVNEIGVKKANRIYGSIDCSNCLHKCDGMCELVNDIKKCPLA